MSCQVEEEEVDLSHGDHVLSFTGRDMFTQETQFGMSYKTQVFIVCRECGARSPGMISDSRGHRVEDAEKLAIGNFRRTWSSSCEFVTVLRVMTE